MASRSASVSALTGGNLEAKDTDWEYGARLGVIFEPSAGTRIGLVWTSEVEYEFEFDQTLTRRAVIGGTRSRTFTPEAGVNSPQQVMGSVFHKLNDRWAVTGNLGWQDWSAYTENSLETNNGTITSSLKLQDTWHAALGAQYQYSASTKVNFGVAYDTSFYEDQDRTSFAMPNGDTWRFATGAQYTLSPKSELGVAVEYLRSDSGRDPSALIGGEYDTPYMVFLSAHYSYRF